MNKLTGPGSHDPELEKLLPFKQGDTIAIGRERHTFGYCKHKLEVEAELADGTRFVPAVLIYDPQGYILCMYHGCVFYKWEDDIAVKTTVKRKIR